MPADSPGRRLKVFAAGLYELGSILVSRPPATASAPTGDYVRLFVVCVVFYSLMYLWIVWWAAIPAIIGLGVLAACVRRTTAPCRKGV